MLLALSIVAFGAESDSDHGATEDRARTLTRNGAVTLSAGVAGAVSGVFVMLVGRGEPGELSKETQMMSDLRSAGGAVLVIGGFSAALVGGNALNEARAVREQLAVAPVIGPGGGGVAVVGRF